MKKVLLGLIVLSVLSIGFGGCGGVKDEKQAFIDATVEATCMLFQADNVFDPALADKANEVFKSYGFSTDDAAMKALTAKYENDEDVQAALTKALEECAGDKADALQNVFGGGEDNNPATDEAAPVE